MIAGSDEDEKMADTQRRFPLKVTQVQRKVVAEIASELSDRLKLDERSQRTVSLTLAELKAIRAKAGKAMRDANKGILRNSLRHVTDLAAQALERSQGIGAIPAAERVYQVKITLKDSHPLVWRCIQVKDGTLDKLHEHIQTAMDWTNSHLHHFQIGDQYYPLSRLHGISAHRCGSSIEPNEKALQAEELFVSHGGSQNDYEILLRCRDEPK